MTTDGIDVFITVSDQWRREHPRSTLANTSTVRVVNDTRNNHNNKEGRKEPTEYVQAFRQRSSTYYCILVSIRSVFSTVQYYSKLYVVWPDMIDDELMRGWFKTFDVQRE